MSECMYKNCDICNESIPHTNNISYVLTIRDDIKQEVRFLSFCTLHCLGKYIDTQGDHIPDVGKMVDKKLKPVDENCLYKPVIISYDFANKVHPIYSEKLIYLGTYREIVYTWDLCNFTVGRSDVERVKLERITDQDYGDGGNYE